MFICLRRFFKARDPLAEWYIPKQSRTTRTPVSVASPVINYVNHEILKALKSGWFISLSCGHPFVTHLAVKAGPRFDPLHGRCHQRSPTASESIEITRVLGWHRLQVARHMTKLWTHLGPECAHRIGAPVWWCTGCSSRLPCTHSHVMQDVPPIAYLHHPLFTRLPRSLRCTSTLFQRLGSAQEVWFRGAGIQKKPHPDASGVDRVDPS